MLKKVECNGRVKRCLQGKGTQLPRLAKLPPLERLGEPEEFYLWSLPLDQMVLCQRIGGSGERWFYMLISVLPS